MGFGKLQVGALGGPGQGLGGGQGLLQVGLGDAGVNLRPQAFPKRRSSNGVSGPSWPT